MHRLPRRRTDQTASEPPERCSLEASRNSIIALVPFPTSLSILSPADDAGLQAAFSSQSAAASSDALRPGGDVILEADSNDMASIDELAAYLDENKQPGDSVELTVLRDGETVSLTAQLADWPS